MVSRSLLVVVLVGALGLGERAGAAVVEYGSPVVFSFDLPDLSTGYFVPWDISIEFGCNSGWPCASDWDYRENPETGEWERISHPPDIIAATIGTGPGRSDLFSFSDSGFGYPSNPSMSFYGSPYEIPDGRRTVYATFMVGDMYDFSTFYKVDFARFSFFWGEEYDPDNPYPAPDNVVLDGRLYDPFAPVPLPGSLLLILSSLGACTMPAIRKRLRGQA